MESTGDALCNNLIEWLKTLDLEAKHGTPSELSDGVAIAEALSQIAPEFFTEAWNSRIIAGNWRLKLSNLRKILDGLINYHQDILNVNLEMFPRPEVENIAKTADTSDLGKLLLLVLSCAVNCEKKKVYTSRIMEMERSYQMPIIQVIEELKSLALGGLHVPSLEPAPPDQTEEELREALAQRCHDLDKQVKTLQEEKTTLLDQVFRLTTAREAADEPKTELNDQRARADALERELATTKLSVKELQDELDKVGAQGAKVDALEKKIAMLQQKNAELQSSQNSVARLRDEVDELRETAAKVSALQALVSSYEIRMVKYDDLKRQVKTLESEKEEYIRGATQNKQERSRLQARYDQLDMCMNQVKKLNEDLNQEIDRMSNFEIENQKLSFQADLLQRKVEALVQERDSLKDELLKLRCTVAEVDISSVSRELMPNDMKERLLRLEHENKLLRENQAQQQDHAATQELFEDYAKRLEELRVANRDANQRIVELEARQSAFNLESETKENQRISVQVKQLQGLLASEKEHVAKLQEELAELQDRYSRDIGKTRSITGSRGELLVQESRLLASAWHQFGVRGHRDAVDSRLRLLSAGHSFMARQRIEPTRI